VNREFCNLLYKLYLSPNVQLYIIVITPTNQGLNLTFSVYYSVCWSFIFCEFYSFNFISSLIHNTHKEERYSDRPRCTCLVNRMRTCFSSNSELVNTYNTTLDIWCNCICHLYVVIFCTGIDFSNFVLYKWVCIRLASSCQYPTQLYCTGSNCAWILSLCVQS